MMKKILLAKTRINRTTIQAYSCSCICGNYCYCHCDGTKLDSVDNRVPSGASLTSGISANNYAGK